MALNTSPRTFKIRDMRRLLLTAVVAVLFPLAASAQANPDSVRFRNDCRLAMQVVTTGHPAMKIDWAMAFVRECPGLAGNLARALREARTSRDTAELNRLTTPADWLRDGALFSTARELLADETASPEARVFAVRVLMWAYVPGMEIDYQNLVDTDGDGIPTCSGLGPGLHGELQRGAPLPGDWIAQGQALGRAVALDTGGDARVRQAARCLAVIIPFPQVRDMH
jgi:hypothetical protein